MNPYFEQAVMSADPVELIRMIYQQAIRSVGEARLHLRERRIPERTAAIVMAYRAIAELISALRPEVAPDLTGKLESLYFYMQKRLLEANMQQADAPLAEVLGLLTTLDEGWAGVAGKLAAENRAASGAAEAQQVREIPARLDAGRGGSNGPGYGGLIEDPSERLAMSA